MLDSLIVKRFDQHAQKLGQAAGRRQGVLMKIEEILHSGGTPKNRSHRSAELAGKRLLRKQFSDIAAEAHRRLRR